MTSEWSNIRAKEEVKEKIQVASTLKGHTSMNDYLDELASRDLQKQDVKEKFEDLQRPSDDDDDKYKGLFDV